MYTTLSRTLYKDHNVIKMDTLWESDTHANTDKGTDHTHTHTMLMR